MSKNENETSLDFLDQLAGQEAAAKELLAYGESLIERAKVAKHRLAEQAAFDRDLNEGSLDSLRRVKERVNTSIDEMIQHTLGI